MSDVPIDIDDDIGWARLGLIADLRTLRDAGQVRWRDGHLEMRPELLDVVRLALAGQEPATDPPTPVRQSQPRGEQP
jgi:hypothetical protein